MPPTTRYCPKCACPLTVPHPPPEKMACPKCAAILKFAHAKVANGAPGSGDRPAVSSPVGYAQATGGAVKTGAKQVAGYQLQRELARGGLGVIYLAYHPHLKTFRAVKRPLDGGGPEREVVLARFSREMQAVADLNSNHIIRAFDAGEDGEGPYMVTEYLDGESLSGLATRLCMLPIPEACELIRQAALGLQAAHQRGLVHRDIKPSNLMLARDQGSGARVVVIDWGLVKMAGEAPTARLTQLHTEMGTLDYIAPEQIRDAHSVDIRADIYSLGATLYCLLAGQPPFAGRSDDQKRQAQVQEKFPHLDQVRPSVPRPVLDILEKMVKKNPAERYQTPGEVANALQPFGCADSRMLLALLAPSASSVPTPHPANETPNLQMRDILAAGTIMAPPPSATPSYPRNSPTPLQPVAATAPVQQPKRSGFGIGMIGLIAAGFCGVMCTGVAGLVAYEQFGKADGTAIAKDKDKDKDNTKDKAHVFIDENFKEAYANRAKSTLPKDWEGDAYHLTKDGDDPCMESTKPAEANWVKLPKVSLDGDFLIDGTYQMSHYQNITFRLENNKAKLAVAINITFDGKITIVDDTRNPPSGYKAHALTRFGIKREGKKLRVFLNDDVVDKVLPEVLEVDTIKINMFGQFNGRPVHLYTLRVVGGNVDGLLDSLKPPGGDKKDKK